MSTTMAATATATATRTTITWSPLSKNFSISINSSSANNSISDTGRVTAASFEQACTSPARLALVVVIARVSWCCRRRRRHRPLLLLLLLRVSFWVRQVGRLSQRGDDMAPPRGLNDSVGGEDRTFRAFLVVSVAAACASASASASAPASAI